MSYSLNAAWKGVSFTVNLLDEGGERLASSNLEEEIVGVNYGNIVSVSADDDSLEIPSDPDRVCAMLLSDMAVDLETGEYVSVNPYSVAHTGKTKVVTLQPRQGLLIREGIPSQTRMTGEELLFVCLYTCANGEKDFSDEARDYLADIIRQSFAGKREYTPTVWSSYHTNEKYYALHDNKLTKTNQTEHIPIKTLMSTLTPEQFTKVFMEVIEYEEVEGDFISEFFGSEKWLPREVSSLLEVGVDSDDESGDDDSSESEEAPKLKKPAKK